MCGRFLLNPAENAEIAQILQQIVNKGFEVKIGEVFPSEQIAVLTAGEQQRVLGSGMSWGFDTIKGDKKLINARAETVLDKPTFQRAFLENRCIILTTGFFEWNKHKAKFRFNLAETEALYLAGFWQQTAAGNQTIILTTSSNDSAQIREVHDRMPLILAKSDLRRWLFDREFAVQYLSKQMPDLTRKLENKKENGQMSLFEK